MVTGASRGIGLEIAKGFAEQGASLIICARSRIEIDSATLAIERRGQKCLGFVSDTSCEEDMKTMVNKSLETFGRIDVLVNNAGIGNENFIGKSSFGDWKKIIDVNLNGFFLCTHLVIPQMIERRSGRIINISSLAATRTPPGFSAYSAAKAGVVAATKSLATELGHLGVYVNALLPGAVETKMFKDGMKRLSQQTHVSQDILVHKILSESSIGRFITEREVANVALFLASNEASGVNGCILPVSGGA